MIELCTMFAVGTSAHSTIEAVARTSDNVLGIHRCRGSHRRLAAPDRRPASAIKVTARAEDSSDIRAACRRLLDLHPKAPAAAHAPVGKTIDWMKVQYDGEVDYFKLDPVAYPPGSAKRA